MLRELRADDAEAVAELITVANAHRNIDADEVRSWLSHADVDPANCRVLEHAGAIAGYVDLVARGDRAVLDASGPGREDALLDWAEARAREQGATTTRLQVWEGQDELVHVLERRGYAPVRSSFEMLIELGAEPPPAPAWPSGIDVRSYRHPEDERVTYETQEESFRDAWDHEPVTLEAWRDYQLGGRGFDPSLWFLAWDGDDVAGICLSFPMARRAADPGLAWISILGVRRPWRRRGVGEALLRHAFRELHARGVRRVGLDVDAESPTGATRLYERVGMRIAVRSDTWEKTL